MKTIKKFHACKKGYATFKMAMFGVTTKIFSVEIEMFNVGTEMITVRLEKWKCSL